MLELELTIPFDPCFVCFSRDTFCPLNKITSYEKGEANVVVLLCALKNWLGLNMFSIYKRVFEAIIGFNNLKIIETKINIDSN